MAADRGMTIYFLDGSKMGFDFPKQIGDNQYLPLRLEGILKNDLLFVEAEGAVLAFPFANIKYIQLFPAPQDLPDYAIKGATIR